jgi:hypothetical protein
MATGNYNPYLAAAEINWRDKRYDYTSGNLDYIGFSLSHDPSTSEGQRWWIWKYTWNATPNVTRMEGPVPGNWDDRASLNWG